MSILTNCTTTAPQFSQSTQHIYKQNPLPSNPNTTAAHAEMDGCSFLQGDTHTTWQRLQPIPLKKLALLALADSNPYQKAWFELAIISKHHHHNTKELVQQLLDWRKNNLTHPGNQLIANNNVLNSLLNEESAAHHIALLLPLSGPLAANGQAVRDGFLSAYYESLAKTHLQQTISFYDTHSNSVKNLYQKALAEGADRVVGPLMKEEVDSILNSGSFTVPTLALNYTDGNLPINFYEFGLSPVHESQQVADKAWQAGHLRAIIIAPQTAWGQRVTTSLILRWQSVGGTVTDALYFTPETHFPAAIATLLRARALDNHHKKLDNKTIVEQQRRQDFDVIFLLAQPEDAREIVPLLKFNYANHIPIYSTSAIYSGEPHPERDVDLNGVIFADIPWLLKASHPNTNRLYAVGRDAYKISNELPRMIKLPNFPVYAATGALTLTATQQIYRRLPWTQIQNGHP